MENRLFKKFVQSTLSPEEFEEFCTQLGEREAVDSLNEPAKDEWTTQMENQEANRTNPLLYQQIRHAILQRKVENSRKKLRLYTIGLRIAAVLLLGMISTSLWFYQQMEKPGAASQLHTVNIPFGAKTQLTLPDGSNVWLNSGSSLQYAESFGSERKVVLKGEAFFDVVKSKQKFTVETSYGDVEVLGTAFNVLAYNDGEFTTTLERGSVSVSDSRHEEQLVIKPGEQVQLVNSHLVRSEVDTKQFTSWKEGKLVFSRDKFTDIMKRLERWYNVKIEYSPSDFDKLWFSGVIESETLTEVLTMICKTAPVRYTYDSASREVKIEAIDSKLVN